MPFEEYGVTQQSGAFRTYAGYPMYAEDPRAAVADILGRIQPSADDDWWDQPDNWEVPVRRTLRGARGFAPERDFELSFDLEGL